jgi:hypothetical protein
MALWSAETVAAAPDGGGLLSWRPRSPLQRQSYGTGRGLVRFWWRREFCAGSEFVNPASSPLGNEKFDLVVTSSR